MTLNKVQGRAPGSTEEMRLRFATGSVCTRIAALPNESPSIAAVEEAAG
jgi:hypothetical protein